MKKTIRAILTLLTICCVFALSACSEAPFINQGDILGGGQEASDIPDDNSSQVFDSYASLIEAMDIGLSDKDTLTSAEESFTTITLNNEFTVVNGEGATFDALSGRLSITEQGTYLIIGSLQGQIYVNVDKNVHIILDGVDISSNDGSAIAIFGKKKKIITLAPNSINTLTDSSVYNEFYGDSDNDQNGALFCKKALTINGSGKLTVNGNYNNGISCKDVLRIVGGDITVNAANNGIKGNDNVFIYGEDTIITVVAKGDAIKSDNEDLFDDDGFSTGNFYLSEATLTLTSTEDGIQAFNMLYIQSGSVTIKTGGGSNASISDESSAKGLKSDTSIYLREGSFSLDCADDSIHSDGDIVIDGGDYIIATGDDAVHSEIFLVFNNGDMEITQCYEGLESAKVIINGGIITLTSSDDGINAADGTTNTPGISNPNCYIKITGGTIYVNAQGDGVDSNGTILMTGGELYISGPTNSSDSSLDTDGGFVIQGGKLFATGTMGMVETPASNSTQCVISFASQTQLQVGTKLILKDESGNVVLEYVTEKRCQSIIISAPDLALNNSYSLYSENVLLSSFKITSIITTIGTSANPGAGGNPFNPPGRF